MSPNAVAKPLVSFVIPVLNGERYLARCLLSIRDQQDAEWVSEVQIIDNGSTDRTHQIIRDLGFDFRLAPELNVSALRNRGAAMAQGEYVAFVDSDVELAPQWLQGCLAAVEGPKVVASGCFPGVPSDATWVQRAWDLHQQHRRSGVKPAAVPWVSSMNLLVRRDDFLAASGFNEHLETAEDVDLCYRLGQRGTILYNPAMQAVHWGETRNLRSFWRKEVWRGLGNLRGVLSHGLRWDELPSLGYPLYIICLVLLTGLGCFIDLSRQQMLLVPNCLFFILLPALLLALDTARRAKRPGAIPQLLLVYFIYGLGRTFAVVNAWRASPA